MKSTVPTILISSVALVVAVVALVVAVVALAARPAVTTSRDSSASELRRLMEKLAAGRAKKSAPPDDVGSGTATAGREVETDKEIHVSLVGEEGLRASFVRKTKSEKGYEVTVRFTNTTDMTVTSLSTACYLYEGDRKMGTLNVNRLRHPALIAAKSHEDIIWIDGVAPSIDRIVIEVRNVSGPGE